VFIGKQQADTSVGEDALHHRESLLIVTTRDLGDVALELITQRVEFNLSGNTFVIENAHFALIVDFEELLAASSGVGKINLHGGPRTPETV